MAGEIRGSFRQAMSEMFLGGDDPVASNKNPQQTEQNESQNPQATGPAVAPPTSGGISVATSPGPQAKPQDGQDSNVTPHPQTAKIATSTQNPTRTSAQTPTHTPAHTQLERMHQDISGLEPKFSDTGNDMNSNKETDTRPSQTSPEEISSENKDEREILPNTPALEQKDAGSAESSTPQGPARTTVIAEGTEIKGEVKLASNAEIYGIVEAKVVSNSNILANTGTITGDVAAKNVDLLNAAVTGNVATAGDLRLSDSSVLTGDVAASRMDLRGAVIGNTAVRREFNVHSTAKLEGDVEAGSIAIGHGARVHGFISVGNEEGAKP